MRAPIDVRTRRVKEDAPAILEEGERFLARTLVESGQRQFVIGLSGGLDSATVALWAARAVGADRLILVSLPYGQRTKGRFPSSSDSSVSDADLVGDLLASQGATYFRSDIAPAVDAEAEAMGLSGEAERQKVALGNLKARIRAARLRTLANLHAGLLLGTENRTEHLLGYFTLGGDEESDLEILAGFYKSEVRLLAGALQVPEGIRRKAPSADLWPGQEDEGELGFSYEIADAVLAQMDAGGEEASAIPEELQRRVLDQVRRTQFKRDPKASFDPYTTTEP